jgi:hypothetical protein
VSVDRRDREAELARHLDGAPPSPIENGDTVPADSFVTNT